MLVQNPAMCIRNGSSIEADVLVNPMLWSEVEVSMLILCAGIPSLRPFLQCFPRVYKAFGLLSNSKINPDRSDRSLQHLSTTLTDGSGGHKQSRVTQHEPLQLEVADRINFPRPPSEGGSTELILLTHGSDERC